MKKFGLILVIFLLILSTAIIKNSAKEIEDEIFSLKEDLRVLSSEFEKVKLEHDYLSSSEKLLEYQSLYFEDELIQKNIESIKHLIMTNKTYKNFSVEITRLETLLQIIKYPIRLFITENWLLIYKQLHHNK